MDFDRLNDSVFFKLGSFCYYLNDLTLEKNEAFHGSWYMYNFDDKQVVDQSDFYTMDYENIHNKKICRKLSVSINTMMNLDVEVPGREYLPTEFKTLLNEQYKEITDLVSKIINDYNKTSTEPISLIRGLVTIAKPGYMVPLHTHKKGTRTTLTIAHKFPKENSSSPSYMLMTHKEHKVKIPEVDKFYFMFRDNPLHGVESNHWMFFWTADFTELIPNPNCDFYQLDDDSFDEINNKLKDYEFS